MLTAWVRVKLWSSCRLGQAALQPLPQAEMCYEGAAAAWGKAVRSCGAAASVRLLEVAAAAPCSGTWHNTVTYWLKVRGRWRVAEQLRVAWSCGWFFGAVLFLLPGVLRVPLISASLLLSCGNSGDPEGWM